MDERRRELEDIRVRALECTARRSLAIGGAEIAVAQRTARRLIELAPYLESGYALLMDAFERQGNIAQALRVYEGLRGLLRDDLGAASSPTVRHMHQRLLMHESIGWGRSGGAAAMVSGGRLASRLRRL